MVRVILLETSVVKVPSRGDPGGWTGCGASSQKASGLNEGVTMGIP